MSTRVGPEYFCDDFDPEHQPPFLGAVDDPEAERRWLQQLDGWYQAQAYVQAHRGMGQFRNAYEVPAEGVAWTDRLLQGEPLGSLIFCGPVGVGKSHAAAATACFAGVMARHRLNGTHVAHFVSATDYFYSQRDFEHRKTIAAAFEDAIGAGVLVLDDIGRGQDLSDFEMETMTRLLDRRRDLDRPTIMTTNLKPAEFEWFFGAHLTSRILHGATPVTMSGVDRRLAG